ncbi:MAG TPA: formate/nitrite transporter family protein [Xanthobacteraceae bacterium]|jgi:formate/nitrite transporter FocA (FNT family)
MYFLPLAWLLTITGKLPDQLDASVITIPGIIHNLVPVTIGNIVGGSGFVGLVYWWVYRKGLRAGAGKH